MKKPLSTSTSKELISLPGKPDLAVLPAPQPVAAVAPALPTDAPPNLSSEVQENLERLKRQAELLREFSFGCYLTSIFGGIFGKQIDPAGIQYYRDQLLRDAGNPVDPIERLLIEQLALAHHSIAQLYRKAAAAKKPEEIEIYHRAATRLLGEFRRSAQCYREFRLPAAQAKQITLVAQQNLAAGDQQVAYVEGGAAGLSDLKNPSCTKLPSGNSENHHG